MQIRALAPDALQAYRVHEAATVKTPYVGLGIALVLLAIAIGSFKLPKIEHAQHKVGEKVNDSIWRHPNLIFGAIAIFVYVGGEVSIGSFLVNYFSQPEIGGLTEKVAASFVAFYWGGAMVGRFIGSALLQKMKTGRPAGHLRGVRGGSGCDLHADDRTYCDVQHHPGRVLQFHHVPQHLHAGSGRTRAAHGDGSGIMIMAIVGGAIIPVAQGAIADRIGIHHAFFLPVICYLVHSVLCLERIEAEQPTVCQGVSCRNSVG